MRGATDRCGSIRSAAPVLQQPDGPVFGAGLRSALCLAVALALHGGLLLTAVQGPAVKPGRAWRAGEPVQVKLQLQLAPNSDVSTELAAHVAERPDDTTSAPGADAPPAPVPTAVSGGAGEDRYLPRPLLSVPPRTLAPIVVAYPEGSVQLDHASVVLSLFIDEHGVVNRVRVDEGEQLPASFQEAAMSAFRDARFVPGELEQQAVKAHIRVEVRFDAGPLPSR